MAVVDINIIKEWFKNLKKPTQEQFWTWLDSFYHKLDGVPMADVNGLNEALQKKADLVNGMVPESQLPFTINTNEVISIGAITVTTNNVHIGVHESGSNKVRINGQILERAYYNDLPFIPVIDGNKFLRIVARNEPGLFFLKQSAESDEPQEPTLDVGEVHVRLILVTPDGSYIDPALLNGFKTKSEDTWKSIQPNKLGSFSLIYNDERTCFSIDETTPSTAIKIIQSIQFSAETTRDVEFLIKNNTAGPVNISSIETDGLSKGFANENLPFSIPVKGAVFVKYSHIKDVIEILKVASTSDMSAYHTITQYQAWVTARNFATQIGLDAEIVNRAAGDNNLQGQVNAINARASSVVDKMLHYWDSTAGKWLSAGIYYLSGKIGVGTTTPAEALEVNGRTKSNSLVLASNIGTAIPNELGRKDGFLTLADASGTPRIYSAGSSFVYTPTGSFLLSAVKAAVEAEKMTFKGLIIYINIGNNNYTCTIDIGTSNTNTSGVIHRSGTGTLSFASVVGRTLDSGVNNITILNGNQSSFCHFSLMDKDYIKIKNF